MEKLGRMPKEAQEVQDELIRQIAKYEAEQERKLKEFEQFIQETDWKEEIEHDKWMEKISDRQL